MEVPSVAPKLQPWGAMEWKRERENTGDITERVPSQLLSGYTYRSVSNPIRETVNMFYSQETINGGEHGSQLSQIPSFSLTEAHKNTSIQTHAHKDPSMDTCW